MAARTAPIAAPARASPEIPPLLRVRKVIVADAEVAVSRKEAAVGLSRPPLPDTGPDEVASLRICSTRAKTSLRAAAQAEAVASRYAVTLSLPETARAPMAQPKLALPPATFTEVRSLRPRRHTLISVGTASAATDAGTQTELDRPSGRRDLAWPPIAGRYALRLA